jgi:NUMOD4 motif
METWKDIKGYEGYYQVSNYGRIKSLTRYENGKGGSLWLKKGRIMKQKIHKGYPMVNLTRDKQCRTFNVYQLVAFAFVPNPENKPCINHIDCNKLNSNALNLEWVTYSENNMHAKEHQLLNPKKVLSDEQVMAILKKSGSMKQCELARLYKVRPNTINYIVRGINRKDVFNQFKSTL